MGKVVKLCSIPKCEIPGCTNVAQNLTGGDNPSRRKSAWVREKYGVKNGWICGKHHSKYVAEKRGKKNIAEVIADNAGFNTVREYQEHQAKKNGWGSWLEYQNSLHPYRWYLNVQPTCENVDGRLGFVCTTTTFPGFGMVDVDHINGNPSHNDRENLQTLCKCCHAYKTNVNADYATPGRKTLKSA